MYPRFDFFFYRKKYFNKYYKYIDKKMSIDSYNKFKLIYKK